MQLCTIELVLPLMCYILQLALSKIKKNCQIFYDMEKYKLTHTNNKKDGNFRFLYRKRQIFCFKKHTKKDGEAE